MQTNEKTRRGAPWFMCYPADWLDGTRDLTPAQRGAFFDCLCLMYQFDRPLPDDERWVAHQLHVSVRLWRRLRGDLISAGKLTVTAAGLTNPRAEAERASRSAKRRASDESRATRARAARDSAASQSRVARENPEISSDFNETPAPEPPYACARQSQLADSAADSDGEGRASVESDAAGAMLADIVGWMPGGDRQAAQGWLAKLVAVYGQGTVRNSYAKLKTDLATGQIIARPLQTWSAIAERMARESTGGGNARDYRTERQRENAGFAAAMGVDVEAVS